MVTTDVSTLMSVFDDIDSLDWNYGFPGTYVHVDDEDLPKFLMLLSYAIDDDCHCEYFGGLFRSLQSRWSDEQKSTFYILLGEDEKYISKLYGIEITEETKKEILDNFNFHARDFVHIIEFELEDYFFNVDTDDNACIELAYEGGRLEDDYCFDDDLNLIEERKEKTMLVTDFLATVLDASTNIKVIDADQVGCMNESCQIVLAEGGKSYIMEKVGDCEVYRFEPWTRRSFKLYVKKMSRG